ncbi:MAG: hypothetical protein ABIS84_15415, partial [Arachnia sp.]
TNVSCNSAFLALTLSTLLSSQVSGASLTSQENLLPAPFGATRTTLMWIVSAVNLAFWPLTIRI